MEIHSLGGNFLSLILAFRIGIDFGARRLDSDFSSTANMLTYLGQVTYSIFKTGIIIHTL